MTKPMSAIGTLTDRVSLKLVFPGTEVPVGNVWARVRELHDRNKYSLVMRYRMDFGDGDLAVHRGRTLRVIKSRDLDGRRAYLQCLCEEVTV